VVWDTNGDGVGDHTGVLSTERGPSGDLLVIHHHRPDAEFSGVPSADDVLARWPASGHFRWQR
jgi:uncharacterized protein YijF (DUF1287 family)